MSEEIKTGEISIEEYEKSKGKALFKDLLYSGGRKVIQKSIKRKINTALTVLNARLNKAFIKEDLKCIESILMYKKNLILLKVHDRFYHPSLIYYTRHKKSGLPVWDMRVMSAVFCEEELDKIYNCIKKSEYMFNNVIKEEGEFFSTMDVRILKDLY